MPDQKPIRQNETRCRLEERDLERIADLCDICRDYFLLVEGEIASLDAAREILRSLPPGRSIEDKFVFGIEIDRRLVALVDLMRNYPSESTWWIGLMLVDPAIRSCGVGTRLFRSVSQWIREQGGKAIDLAVAECNVGALRFWESLGFRIRDLRIDRPVGQKRHTLLVMSRPAC